jgi:lipopolysaccharide/colanic/teichoic acid biosynthesis glycosyltransferase
VNRSTATTQQRGPAAWTADAQPVVWGLPPRELHDRYWASRGVQVVRNAGAPVVRRGPRVYLLLAPDSMVHLDLNAVVDRMRWIKPSAMRVRLVEREEQGYDEHVITGQDGRFLEIRREYRPSTLRTLRIAVTRDPRLAELWRSQPDARSGWRTIQRDVGRDSLCVDTIDGRIFNAADDESCEAGVRELLKRWKSPGAALDGVYEYAPGVWLHESVRISNTVRLVPPLWVGAGVSLRGEQTLIGPAAAPDRGPSPTPTPVDWINVATHASGAAPRPRRRRKLRRVSKRLFDIGFSATVLIATAPLYPILMLAIYLEDGWPVFFAHTRQTTRGREFPCYKFRTMCKNADAMKAQLAAANMADGPQFFIEQDPRLLRSGRLLRKFQFDELPQFWNVLRGHMSVVGPRPSPDKENQFCPAWREARLSVRPGVTGLWQVRRTRAPETDFQEWIRYDLEYVQHESWRLDLWIIVQTVKKVLGG